mmetsp:Transcript_26990/g.55597  ORF Transcript_26990/g.55597 Transcript_26990/m.55597 type:complete len:92 (-) Transcript_26990:26-301(-)
MSTMTGPYQRNSCGDRMGCKAECLCLETFGATFRPPGGSLTSRKTLHCLPSSWAWRSQVPRVCITPLLLSASAFIEYAAMIRLGWHPSTLN